MSKSCCMRDWRQNYVRTASIRLYSKDNLPTKSASENESRWRVLLLSLAHLIIPDYLSWSGIQSDPEHLSYLSRRMQSLALCFEQAATVVESWSHEKRGFATFDFLSWISLLKKVRLIPLFPPHLLIEWTLLHFTWSIICARYSTSRLTRRSFNDMSD